MEQKEPRSRVVRLAALTAVLSLVFATAAVAAITNFVDVPDDHLFATEIAWMHENDITRGCNPPDNDRYCPDDDISRGEMAAFMFRLAHSESLRNHFGGTTETHYIVSEVGALAEEGPTSVTADCEVGDTVVSGGYEGEGVTLVTADRPELPVEPEGVASAWTVSAVGVGDLSVYAVCVNQS